MRIGIVTQSYLPIHGGVAEHVHHTAIELRKRGHMVTVITAYFDRGDENFGDGVIRIGHDLTVPMNGAFVNLTFGARLGAQLKAIERQEKFDVVHIHGPLEPILPIAALRAMQTPIVGTFHSYKEKSGAYQAFGWMLRNANRKIRARIAVSKAAREFISRYFPGDYHIIPNGVDTKRFRPDLVPIPKYDDAIDTVLFVGRMDPRKGLKYLLQAFPTILKECPSTRLVVVGGGFLTGYYRGFVTKEVADRVVFEGFVSGKELPRYYATADIYCSPATANESFGIVLIEAMAAGTPIVASDNIGYSQLLEDGIGGVLVKRKNVPDLARAIIALLKNKQRRKEMGEQGRIKSLQFSWPSVAERVEAVYKSIQK